MSIDAFQIGFFERFLKAFFINFFRWQLMENIKFIIYGKDKKNLNIIKSALVANGNIFIGYTDDKNKILRSISYYSPDLIILDVGYNINGIENIIDIIDEDLLTACILAVNSLTDNLYEYIKSKKIVTYICKPVFDEVIMQISTISLINYNRVLEYEKKMKKLNDTLENRRIIEKAKWILVKKHKISENEAYDLIRTKSRNSRIPMYSIAESIIILEK